MRIGVWLGKHKKPQEGGGFSYVNKLISAIDSYQFDPMVEICFITEGGCLWNLKKEVIELVYSPSIPLSQRIISFFLPIVIIQSIKYRIKGHFRQLIEAERQMAYTEQLDEKNIKLIYYLQQNQCILPDFPFISTNWDIGHRSTYAFPEVISSVNFELRCDFYDKLLPRALFVFAESEAGKREIIKYTIVNEAKIKVVPLFSGDCVNQIMSPERQIGFLKSIKLEKEKFFFYPAQFWAHKNHIGLLKAFSIFLQAYPDFKLVLTGSDKGTLSHVMQQTLQLNIQNSVSFLGFVSTEEINTLYQNATSLVMPTFNGPTNMPLLEAMELGCPVICSDLAGHREELGDSAIYVNPMDPNEMAEAMINLCLHRDKYVQRIKKQSAITIYTIEHALKAIDKNLREAIMIRDTWE